jgi:hypothetical protein
MPYYKIKSCDLLLPKSWDLLLPKSLDLLLPKTGGTSF